MKLATLENVRARLGFGDNLPDVDVALEQALHGATAILKVQLRTAFDRVTGNYDVFYIPVRAGRQTRVGDRFDAFGHVDATGGQIVYTLRTKRGYMLASPVPTIQATPLRATFATGTVGVDITDISAYATVDLAAGRIVINDFDLSGNYVRVGYDSGFAVDGTDQYLFDQTQVPDTLQEAAMQVAIVNLYNNPNVRRGSDANTRELDQLIRLRDDMVVPLVRYEPSAIKAM